MAMQESPATLELSERLSGAFRDTLFATTVRPLTIRISSEGGSYVRARCIAQRLEQEESGVTAMIRQAEGPAAIVALACHRREMEADGLLKLDLGGIFVTGADVFDIDSYLDAFIRAETLVKWHVAWLESRFPCLAAAPEMAALKKDNAVAIDAARAFELGLIHAIV